MLATLGGEPPRLGEQLLGLQQVDDVDPVALAVDVPAHARVPAPRLVAEVKAGLQQLLESGLGHQAPLWSIGVSPPGRSGDPACWRAGQGPVPSAGGSVSGRRGL